MNRFTVYYWLAVIMRVTRPDDLTQAGLTGRPARGAVMSLHQMRLLLTASRPVTIIQSMSNYLMWHSVTTSTLSQEGTVWPAAYCSCSYSVSYPARC